MKTNQLTRGHTRRILYIENKDGTLDGADARVGWATFSKSGLSVYYRGRTLKRLAGGGCRGNYYDEATGDEYWISGIKANGSNRHYAPISFVVDPDACDEYARFKGLLKWSA